MKTVPQDLQDHPKVFTLACVNLVNAMVMQALAIQRLESVWIVGIIQQGITVRPVHLVMLVMLYRVIQTAAGSRLTSLNMTSATATMLEACHKPVMPGVHVPARRMLLETTVINASLDILAWWQQMNWAAPDAGVQELLRSVALLQCTGLP